MGLINRAIEKRYTSISGSSLENPQNWTARAFGAWGVTASGVDVDEKTALYAIDVLTCVRIISETIAQLPLITYKRLDGGGKARATKHPLYSILQEQANEEMTAFVFKETMQAHLLTWGNAYAEIERNDVGDPIGLWPLLPDRTWPTRDPQGNLVYYTQIQKLPIYGDPGIRRILSAKDVFHIPGLGFNGLVGYSVIRMIREQVGLAQAQEEFGSRFYSNNSQPPSVVTVPHKLSPDDFKLLQAQWDDGKRGNRNAWKTALLDQGMDIKSIGMPLADAQFIESRRFSSEKIAGFYRVPPDMMNSQATGGPFGVAVEQRQIGFAKFTIQPWCVRWEHGIDMKLMLRPRDAGYFTEYLIDGLERGDIEKRYNAYEKGWGRWLTTDDIREKENMNPYVAPQDGAIGQHLVWPTLWTTAERLVAGESIREVPSPLPLEPGPVGDPAVGQPDPQQQASIRRALAKSVRLALSDTADRILRRESSDILARSKKPKANWLEALYEDHREYIKKQFGPQLRTYAALIAAEVTRETGQPVTVPEAFVTKYIDGYAQRHIAASRAEMKALTDATPKELEDALATWSPRSEWIALRESNQAGNAFARAAYRELGVPFVVWMTGDDCPDCMRLHGKKTDGVFAQRGELSDDRFVPASGLGHPPLCDGCECVVIADGIVARDVPRLVAAIKESREDDVKSQEERQYMVKQGEVLAALAVRLLERDSTPALASGQIQLVVPPGAFVIRNEMPPLTIQAELKMPKSKGKQVIYDKKTGAVDRVEEL